MRIYSFRTRENAKEEVESNILSQQFYFETNRSLLDTEKEWKTIYYIYILYLSEQKSFFAKI